MNRTDHQHGTKKHHKQNKAKADSAKVDHAKMDGAKVEPKNDASLAKNDQNQGDGVGEGNREAARRYNEGLAQSMARGDNDALVLEAKQALDGPEGAELEAAEEEGKEGEPSVTTRR